MRPDQSRDTKTEKWSAFIPVIRVIRGLKIFEVF
jgi:hypothetical protein